MEQRRFPSFYVFTKFTTNLDYQNSLMCCPISTSDPAGDTWPSLAQQRSLSRQPKGPPPPPQLFGVQPQYSSQFN
ncbi:hypothetical protein E2C01_011015 [Portunus trituberculatus]|uniref:Uncharacterized protein n=1 Tax=Portunus trituberculatus TaxID=210409 RepID=A0A5B7D9W6_PORTR|nr:hypothetical protein [Portunus trituberculatus]